MKPVATMEGGTTGVLAGRDRGHPSASEVSAAGRRVASRLRPKRRVALVTEYYYPHLGGICEHVHFLARELRARGWEADIITAHMEGAHPERGVVRIGRSLSIYANGSHARITVGRHLRRLVRDTLREGNYDLVHVHTPLAPTLPLLALEEADCPVVGTFHTQFGKSLGYEVGRSYFQRRMERLAAAIAVSATASASCDRYFETDWTIIPNGIDVELFRPDVPRPAAMTGDGPTILFLGRLDPRNGLGTLLRAFASLRSDYPGIRLFVVGGGPLRGWYELRGRGLHENIRFVGPVLAERAGYYAHSDVYICPSTKASFGITLLEAMACGTSVVCSDAAGFRHVVTHGREALITPIGDSAAVARALRVLLEDEVLRARMGAAGRARALEFAWPRIADRVLDTYSKVLRVREETCLVSV